MSWNQYIEANLLSTKALRLVLHKAFLEDSIYSSCETLPLKSTRVGDMASQQLCIHYIDQAACMTRVCSALLRPLCRASRNKECNTRIMDDDTHLSVRWSAPSMLHTSSKTQHRIRHVHPPFSHNACWHSSGTSQGSRQLGQHWSTTSDSIRRWRVSTHACSQLLFLCSYRSHYTVDIEIRPRLDQKCRTLRTCTEIAWSQSPWWRNIPKLTQQVAVGVTDEITQSCPKFLGPQHAT